ncbi:MAG: DUF4923 family protein [Prevotella sp.]|nr:DUF4923 family protein [Prevotella sp.]
MKKLSVLVIAAALLLSGCNMSTLNGIGQMDSATAGATIGNVIASVLGLNKMTRQDIFGAWTYTGPGCAFTSDQLLAKAGGEVAAAEIKTKIEPTYKKLGIKASNTSVTFNEDGTFTARFAGKQLSGNYTFDEATYKVTMQTLLLSLNCYAKKNINGIGLLFESSKLLTLLQTMAALSGDATFQTVGELSKNYDGLRLGFDYKR